MLIAPLSCALAPAFAAGEGERFDLRIEGGSLLDAMKTIRRQTDAEYFYSFELAEEDGINPVEGFYTLEEALRLMFEGTGLSGGLTESGMIVITRDEYREAEMKNDNLKRALLAGAAAMFYGGANAQDAVETLDETGAAQDREEDVIIVTGTRIRGGNPTKSVQVYDRDAIDLTGKATIEQFIRTLPQDFRGGASGASADGLLGSGAAAAPNNEAGSAVNLRGLGNEATLILFNGRRIAPAAFGRFIDISIIPLGAVDRIEVLTDGASAVYGSDAVGGVVNIVTRDNYEGAETHVGFGSVTEGAYRDYTAAQTLGFSWNGGNLLAGGQYRKNTALPTMDRTFTENTVQPTDIIGEAEDISGFLSFRQDIARGVEAFGDGLYSSRNNLRTNTISAVNFRTSDADNAFYTANLGLGVEPFGDWRFELTGNLSRQSLDLVFPETSPLPGYTPGDLALENRADVWSVEFQGDGALFDAPGGAVRAALGASYREEDLESFVPYLPEASPSRTRVVNRDVAAVFGEFYIPIIGEANQRRFIRRFDVSAAVRHDDYSDFGGTTNPQIGVLWSPSDEIDFRASWGTAFRAPNASELLNVGLFQSLLIQPFPAPDGGAVPVFILAGVDQGLGPEEAEIWTVGFEYRPSFIDGASLSFNYYDISYEDRIIPPSFAIDPLLRRDFFGSLVTPLADDAAASAFLADALAEGRDIIDLIGSGSAGVRYVIDFQQTNASFVDQSGFDIMARYGFDRGEDRFDVSVNASIINEIVTALTAESTPGDVSNTVGNPLTARLRADVGWSRGAWRANAAVNHRNSYTDTTVVPNGDVGSWTTVDLTFNWSADGFEEALLNGLRVSLSVSNLFDTEPPFVVDAGRSNSNINYDVANADPFGRQIRIDLRKQW